MKAFPLADRPESVTVGHEQRPGEKFPGGQGVALNVRGKLADRTGYRLAIGRTRHHYFLKIKVL